MAQLTCQRLCVGYEGKSVLQELNFEVFAGDYLCIVGENGSGKSTLMKTILGLQPPISGRILTGDGLRKNEIGYLPQQTVVQKDFPAAVREIVLSGCQGRCGSRPFYSKEEKQLAAAATVTMSLSSMTVHILRCTDIWHRWLFLPDRPSVPDRPSAMWEAQAFPLVSTCTLKCVSTAPRWTR